MRFANIYFDRNERLTIGDDMQLLAIENLYKYMGIDYNEVIRIPFHSLATYDGEYVVLPISFPLYGFHYEMAITQFSSKIIPVFLGLSTLSDSYSEEERDYLKKFEPIGCRDLHTMNAMRKNGIVSYLNGCMTATLPLRENTSDDTKRTKIFCIDVPETFKKYIPDDILEGCVFLSHTFYPHELQDGPESKAKELYNMYLDEARMIITTRLHGALPCAAAGIPVILFKDHLSYRFAGIDKLIHVYTEEEYDKIDWNPQPIIYEKHKKMVLNSAADRIREAYHKYKDIYDISSFYESRENRPHFIEFYDNSIAFIDEYFNRDEEIKYALWGVTQTAQSVNAYIQKNYPKAKLVAVVDKVKDIEFGGIRTCRKEWLEDKKDVFCFVCTGAAIKEAYEYFDQIGHEKFYQCCEDGNRHQYEGIRKSKFSNVDY